MKPAPWHHLDQFRMVRGEYASPLGADFGAFLIPSAAGDLRVIASPGEMPGLPWEHVSVNLARRCPNWIEMCRVKELFWSPDEAVVQFHPPRASYINLHPTTLHLWKWLGGEFPMPPTWTIGPRDGESREDCLRAADEALR